MAQCNISLRREKKMIPKTNPSTFIPHRTLEHWKFTEPKFRYFSNNHSNNFWTTYWRFLKKIRGLCSLNIHLHCWESFLFLSASFFHWLAASLDHSLTGSLAHGHTASFLAGLLSLDSCFSTFRFWLSNIWLSNTGSGFAILSCSALLQFLFAQKWYITLHCISFSSGCFSGKPMIFYPTLLLLLSWIKPIVLWSHYSSKWLWLRLLDMAQLPLLLQLYFCVAHFIDPMQAKSRRILEWELAIENCFEKYIFGLFPWTIFQLLLVLL